MSQTTFQRARRPEQKEQRRAAILAAAAELFEANGFEGVSLNAIARRAGLAKSNLYRYFDSREDMFLQLLHDDWEAWFTAVAAGLAPLAGSSDVPAVAAVLAETAAARPRMCKLVSVLSAVIERNISEQTLLDFKLKSLALAQRGGLGLLMAVPALTPDAVAGFLIQQHALIAGLWPMSQPNETVARVMERPELAPYRHDFVDELGRALTWLLLGALEAPAEPEPG